MITIKEMADGYIEQIRFRVTQSEQQLNELKQHLEECENEIQFGQGKKSLGDMENCVPTDSRRECCKSADNSSVPLTLKSLDDTEASQ